ncbi:alpha/beta hydrolase [SAR202 cluster bacterium AC-647-P02_OGT_505m]|nr:alpha/beta hydrolase [SAR202 cluster bacterium AC-647-P02_OGT_505m]
MSSEYQRRSFSNGNLDLSYVEWGSSESPPMVLLHGLQDCARSWDVFSRAMSGEYRVISLDSRGHGCSDFPVSSGLGSGYRFVDYVSDITALIDNLGLEEPILVGHSAGGRYAFSYASLNPQNVRALVVVDIDPDSVNQSSSGMFDRYMNESDEWPSLDKVVERIRSRQHASSETMLNHQAEVMTKPAGNEGIRVWRRDRRVIEDYERPDLWKEWVSIAVPTVIIRGRQSDLLTHQTAVQMREKLSGSLLAELEGGGHWFYQESPGAFESTVRWFLSTLRN